MRTTKGSRQPGKYRPIPAFTEAQTKSFWSRVVSGSAEACWPWIGRRMVGSDRGVFSAPNGGVYPAPRLAWALTHLEDPKEFFILHSCDNANCCNPAHLRPGTNADNVQDMVDRGRTAKGDKNFLHRHPEARNGELNPNAKLSEQDVLEIREEFYLLQMKLANKYHVIPSYILDLVKRKTWKHV